MTNQRTDRGERDSLIALSSAALHQQTVEPDELEEAYARFSRWLDRELARLEERHILVGARPTGVSRR